ncbi:blue copper protein-like [Quillaja saponaria]|uniref:Blue copper protein-like n=1 Tax=Quillaja saponaria TaxID=32244 RepID=A0AAD7Q7P3_QUISA|nr:blue copper protein-like [Quillaja saponaria]
MASLINLVILAIFAVVLPSIAMATEHVVGDDKGWTIDFDYENWAKDKVFVVGDTLVFKYKAPNHNVFKVDGTGFQNCTVPPINEALTTGNDVIPLATSGKKWYICGVGTHCSEHGQKLTINVTESSTAAPSARAMISSGYLVFMAAMVGVAAIIV